MNSLLPGDGGESVQDQPAGEEVAQSNCFQEYRGSWRKWGKQQQ